MHRLHGHTWHDPEREQHGLHPLRCRWTLKLQRTSLSDSRFWLFRNVPERPLVPAMQHAPDLGCAADLLHWLALSRFLRHSHFCVRPAACNSGFVADAAHTHCNQCAACSLVAHCLSLLLQMRRRHVPDRGQLRDLRLAPDLCRWSSLVHQCAQRSAVSVLGADSTLCFQLAILATLRTLPTRTAINAQRARSKSSTTARPAARATSPQLATHHAPVTTRRSVRTV